MKNWLIQFLILSLYIFRIDSIEAQNFTEDNKLASEYFQQGDLPKARSIYEKYTKQPEKAQLFYNNYLSILFHAKDYSITEKFLKKMIKNFDDYPIYKIDLATCLQLKGVQEESDKYLNKIMNEFSRNELVANQAGQYWISQNEYQKAEILYKKTRKFSGDRTLFSFEMADIYKKLKQPSEMINELFNLLQVGVSIDQIKNSLQNLLTTDAEYDVLKTTLIDKAQQEPENTSISELLVWFFMQKKDFGSAFIYAKSLDKQLNLFGSDLIELGKMAQLNRDFKTASKIFDYVALSQVKNANGYLAKTLSVGIKEEIIKNQYPIDKIKVQELINEYKQIQKIPSWGTNLAEGKRSIGILYGHYLSNPDSAISYFNEAILLFPDENNKNKTKLDLGDMFMLKNDFWEAILIYSQVEKSQKDTPIGHEAKFRNARLYYYKGEFVFAQEQLDVLKQATSREIANDAMQLSLVIMDNTQEDTLGLVLKDYSQIELLMYRNEYDSAQSKLDTLLFRYLSTSLRDDMYWLKSKILLKKENYTEAIVFLKIIKETFGDDIWADDAAFKIAEIYEYYLKDIKLAMDSYNDFLVAYPASIYTAEARKRYRILRGDKLQ